MGAKNNRFGFLVGQPSAIVRCFEPVSDPCAVVRGEAVSKKAAAAWVAGEYPQWENLIKTAGNWHYGVKMERQAETIDFIKFALAKVK